MKDASLAPPDLAAATAHLFAPAGPLAAYPGPAALTEGDGTVLAGNGAFERISGALADARGDLRRGIARATASDASPSRLSGCDILGPGGSSSTFDIDILPAGPAALVLARDVSMETALRSALVDSRQRFKDLIEVAADFTWETGPDGTLVFVSPRGAMGYAAAELIGRHPAELLMLPEGAAAFLGDGGKDEANNGVEVWARTALGGAACLLVQAQALKDRSGARIGARGLARDITALKLRESELAAARHRERLVIHLIRTLRRAVDPTEALTTALRSAVQAVGAAGGRICRFGEVGNLVEIAVEGAPMDAGMVTADLLAGRSPAQSEAGGFRCLGLLCHQQGKPAGALMLWRDSERPDWDADDLFLLTELADQLAVVVEQQAGQERLARLSTTDGLTGLLNRRGFQSALERAVERALIDGAGGALFYIDLDNFKQVNDRYGHAQGDAALKAAADLLRNGFRIGDPIGRLGGDEFSAWASGIGAEEAAAKARELLAAGTVLRDFAPGAAAPVGLSIGVAMLAPGGGDAIAALMERADQAMYRIKHGGKGSFVVVES
jgi:diguanylate cyclase (GGDEF)-like protein/PAS domain S-box-containing protein